MTCPLCLNHQTSHFHTDKQRDYLHCEVCDLVFVPQHQLLTANDEKYQYDLHQNSPDDEGYRQFLNRLLLPLAEYLPNNAQGLDFGCGPGPTISVMMAERGFIMNNYDLFYANQPELLMQQYDFITATEVFEHLYQPSKVIPQLVNMLKPKGVLGVMTKRWIDKDAFSRWHYKNDRTHVCFYSDNTFRWIAEQWDLTLKLIGADTQLLFKA
ncbi:class I SAM-dependent methyltransferase [Kangiella koreensis]|uniref:Methyltransferase-related protein n=1 Tax=Kangiella koreensis (strain DSM 16069 / JCM 12317 / KCTC 12182 / SW-125) TaxID=523791 RepID=C7R8P6_KANKD|nr:class I SAM-dependent methyltransferase [Kangiella koreensis]ACV25909.1 methyltransferase-related protein [Kangiella koreensis DSM 16069]